MLTNKWFSEVQMHIKMLLNEWTQMVRNKIEKGNCKWKSNTCRRYQKKINENNLNVHSKLEKA